jgi:hypothetical protein
LTGWRRAHYLRPEPRCPDEACPGNTGLQIALLPATEVEPPEPELENCPYCDKPLVFSGEDFYRPWPERMAVPVDFDR